MSATLVMRDFINLLAPNPQVDDRFGPQPGWQLYAQIWASVTPLVGTQAGNEMNTAQGVQSLVNFTVVTRYRTDVTNQHRVVYRGQTLDILSVVDPDGARTTLNIQARQYPGTL